MPERLEQLRRDAAGTRLHVLCGDEVVVEGVRFLGATLWTNFAARIAGVSNQVGAMMAARNGMNDYRMILSEPGRVLRPEDTLRLHQQHSAWLLERLRIKHAGSTVVVTHMAPHANSLAERFARIPMSAAYVNDLDGEFFDRADLWVHGHTHSSFDYEVGACRVICNPRGYVGRGGMPENERFDDARVVQLG